MVCECLEGWWVRALTIIGRVILVRYVLIFMHVYFLSNTIIHKICLVSLSSTFGDFSRNPFQADRRVSGGLECDMLVIQRWVPWYLTIESKT